MTANIHSAGLLGSATHWSGTPPSLLLCHGFTGDSLDFAPLTAHLKNEAGAIDLPGHGEWSPARAAFPSFGETSRCIADMVSHQSVLLGYSLGGRLALDAVARHGAQPRALILIGASPGLTTEKERAARVHSDEQLAAQIIQDGTEAFLEAWNQRPLIATQAKIDPEYREAMMARRRRCTGTGWAESLRHHGTGVMPSLWPFLRQVRCPVLLLTGESDSKFEGIARRMVPDLPNALWHTIPNAGHCAHLENPMAAARLISSFTAEKPEDSTG